MQCQAISMPGGLLLLPGKIPVEADGLEGVDPLKH